MKKLLPLFVLLALFLTGCEKDDPPATPVIEIDNRVVFWSNFQGEPITVYINGSNVGTITAISSSSPGCGSSGNITRTLSPGTYSFTASESGDNPYSWSGSFNIESDVSCLNYLLHI